MRRPRYPPGACNPHTPPAHPRGTNMGRAPAGRRYGHSNPPAPARRAARNTRAAPGTPGTAKRMFLPRLGWRRAAVPCRMDKQQPAPCPLPLPPTTYRLGPRLSHAMCPTPRRGNAPRTGTLPGQSRDAGGRIRPPEHTIARIKNPAAWPGGPPLRRGAPAAAAQPSPQPGSGRRGHARRARGPGPRRTPYRRCPPSAGLWLASPRRTAGPRSGGGRGSGHPLGGVS
jgi:hypothetical protein